MTDQKTQWVYACKRNDASPGVNTTKYEMGDQCSQVRERVSNTLSWFFSAIIDYSYIHPVTKVKV